MVGQQRQLISELQFDKFPTPSSFLCWNIRFTNQVTSGSGSPSEGMLWIKEVDIVGSVDDFKSSRSIQGCAHFPNFEMLDAKIASALNKIIQKILTLRRSQSRGTERPERGLVSTGKTDRLHDLRLLSSDWRS